MNFEILFQLLSLALIVVSGPLIVVLLATQEENGL
jgi:Photosystem II complex subunit Ycf12